MNVDDRERIERALIRRLDNVNEWLKFAEAKNADGTDVRRVGNTRAGSTAYLSWSPDSTRVAFVSDTYVDPHGDDIIVAFADGSDEIQLTLSDAVDSDPTWLPPR